MYESYENFINELKKNIHMKLNIPLNDMEFHPKDTVQYPNGDRLVVVIARHETATEACGFYVRELYEVYQNGTSMEEIVKKLAHDVQRTLSSSFYEKSLGFKNYAQTKQDLFIRPLNADVCSERLKDAIYKQIGDIALVLYVKVADDGDGTVSTMIHRSIFQCWGLDETYVFEEALKNTYRMTPPRIYKWEQMLFSPEYDGEDFMNTDDSGIVSNAQLGNCLSTSTKINGAVAIFFPGVAERVASLLNTDFYIVFTSIHEVMLHCIDTVTPEDLQRILRDTIQEATPEADFLSYKIYQYNRNSKKFMCVME